jgi:hypothetical protein
MTVALPYPQLMDLVLEELERVNDDELIANFPRIVMLAQNDIDNKLKALGEVDVFKGNFIPPDVPITSNILAKPADWKYTLTFEVRTGVGSSTKVRILSEAGYDAATFLWPDSSETDEPEYYADFSYNLWLVVPTPDRNYQFQVSYVKRNPPIDMNTQTNWLTQNAPKVLFDATMVQAAIFTQNTVRKPEFEETYEKTLAAYSAMDKERVGSRRSDRFKD